jgi:oxygen-dependent protoporphyrinogen oxidase
MNNPIVIIGAGITGLATAYYLEKAGHTNITILECSNRSGGKASTIYENGFLIESGPDSFITTKPYLIDLIKDIGLEGELINPEN